MSIIFLPCAYCGLENSMQHDGHGIKFNGIDRINNEIGYLKDNIIQACTFCNRAKHKMSVKEFLNWIEKVAKFNLIKIGE